MNCAQSDFRISHMIYPTSARGSAQLGSLQMQGLGSGFTMVLAGDVINGVGASVLSGLVYTVVSDMLPPEQSRCAESPMRA